MRKGLLDPSPARAAAYVALYPMLVQIARDHGYALAVHGSLHRDFDMIAVPWIEEASDHVDLIHAFKVATRAVFMGEDWDYIDIDKHFGGTPKPHGRRAYSLHCTRNGMYGGYLDISVMPRTKPTKIL